MVAICFVSWSSPYLLEYLEAALLFDGGIILLLSGEMTQEKVHMGERRVRQSLGKTH